MVGSTCVQFNVHSLLLRLGFVSFLTALLWIARDGSLTLLSVEVNAIDQAVPREIGIVESQLTWWSSSSWSPLSVRATTSPSNYHKTIWGTFHWETRSWEQLVWGMSTGGATSQISAMLEITLIVLLNRVMLEITSIVLLNRVMLEITSVVSIK